jgi:hypothetical protein
VYVVACVYTSSVCDILGFSITKLIKSTPKLCLTRDLLECVRFSHKEALIHTTMIIFVHE